MIIQIVYICKTIYAHCSFLADQFAVDEVIATKDREYNEQL